MISELLPNVLGSFYLKFADPEYHLWSSMIWLTFFLWARWIFSSIALASAALVNFVFIRIFASSAALSYRSLTLIDIFVFIASSSRFSVNIGFNGFSWSLWMLLLRRWCDWNSVGVLELSCIVGLFESNTILFLGRPFALLNCSITFISFWGVIFFPGVNFDNKS